MPPRRKGEGHIDHREATVAHTPDQIAHSRFFALLNVVWEWSWQNKAISSALIGLMIIIAAVLLQPSNATMVTHALSTKTLIEFPLITPFVERRDMAVIFDAIEMGKNYIIVDGGNRVGKSVVVEAVASRFSHTRTVRRSQCNEGSSAVSILRHLFGLDKTAGAFSRVLLRTLQCLPSEPPSVAIIEDLVRSISCSSKLEPVFVVEMAERLEIKELKTLLDFAKVLVDKGCGRFIFVFSPTDKLDTIGDFGSVSRAEVVHIGDFSETETTTFLVSLGCDADQAIELYNLIGGHLPYLMQRSIRDYCHSLLPLPKIEAMLLEKIGSQVEAVDRVLGIGSACSGLCGVQTNVWPKREVIDLLLKKHLIIAALNKGIFIESQMIRSFMNLHCSCYNK